MSQIKTTCTNLTALLHQIREHKDANEGVVEDDLVADAMLLFAQLSGQHSKLMREAENEYEKIYEVSLFIEVSKLCHLSYQAILFELPLELKPNNLS